MKKLEYLKMRQMMIIDLLERYTRAKMPELAAKISAVTEIKDLELLSDELRTIYHTIQDIEFKQRIDPILQNTHVMGREKDLLVMNAEQNLAVLKNEFRFLKPKLLKANNESAIPLLPIQIYSLIARILEKESYRNTKSGQTLVNFSRACTTFWRASKAQIVKLKEKGPLFQIMLLGDSGAGKSCLRQRFITGEFPQNPIAIDNQIGTTNLCSLRIRDPARGDKFAYVNANYYGNNILGYMIVFDLADPASFNNVKEYLKEIDRYGLENAVRILVGTKSDLTAARVVDFNIANDFAENLGISYVETSAMTGNNINQPFDLLAQELTERFRPPIRRVCLSLADSEATKPKKEACTVQ